jgi:hypothetical protein
VIKELASAAALLAALALPNGSAIAQTTPVLQPALAPIAFLVGTWTSAAGTVADTGETAAGRSTISVEVGGAAMLRRDHTDLSRGGKATESFDQLMLIYPESATLHADYTDGTHVIHYASAAVIPDRSIAFTSVAAAGAPTYRLTYEVVDADTISVHFDVEPPGASAFVPIATGTLHRST